VTQIITKAAKGPRCGDTGVALNGVRCSATLFCDGTCCCQFMCALPGLLQIPRLRPTEYARIPKHDRTVTRAYGGCLSAKAVRERILRAFIIEEQRIVKKVLQDKVKAAKAAAA